MIAPWLDAINKSFVRLILELRVQASFCLPRQIFNFPSNLWIRLDETAKEFTLIA